MKRTLALLAVGALALAACGDDESSGVSASGAWARTSPMSSEIGAMYFVLESDVADELTAVNVPAEVAGRTELHETVMAPPTDDTMTGDTMTDDTMTGDDGSSSDMGGVMTMQQVTSVPLPAGTEVAFVPGGLHVMLLDLAAPLEAGTSFEATLVFADADPVDVTVEVRDEAP